MEESTLRNPARQLDELLQNPNFSSTPTLDKEFALNKIAGLIQEGKTVLLARVGDEYSSQYYILTAKDSAEIDMKLIMEKYRPNLVLSAESN